MALTPPGRAPWPCSASALPGSGSRQSPILLTPREIRSPEVRPAPGEGGMKAPPCFGISRGKPQCQPSMRSPVLEVTELHSESLQSGLQPTRVKSWEKHSNSSLSSHPTGRHRDQGHIARQPIIALKSAQKSSLPLGIRCLDPVTQDIDDQS